MHVLKKSYSQRVFVRRGFANNKKLPPLDGDLPKPRQIARQCSGKGRKKCVPVLQRLVKSGMLQGRGEWTKMRDKDGA